MKVVIDTNVFVTIFSPLSKNYPIFQALIQGKITLCVTTDILDEYAEITVRFLGKSFTNDVLELLELLPNVEYHVKYYRWNLIVADPDDDKFVDCFVASSADFLLTEDRHFKVLEKIPFPPVKVVKASDFLKRL